MTSFPPKMNMKESTNEYFIQGQQCLDSPSKPVSPKEVPLSGKQATDQKVNFQRQFISHFQKGQVRFAFEPNLYEVLRNLFDDSPETDPYEISCTHNTLGVLLEEPSSAKEEIYTVYVPKGRTGDVRHRLCALFKDYLNQEIGFDEIDYKEALEALKIDIHNKKGFTSVARIKSLAMLKFGCQTSNTGDLIFQAHKDKSTVRFVFKEEQPTRLKLLQDQIPLKELLLTKRVEEISSSILEKTRQEAIKERIDLIKAESKVLAKEESKVLVKEIVVNPVKKTKDLAREGVVSPVLKTRDLAKELTTLIEKQKHGSNKRNLSEILDPLLEDPIALDSALSHLASLDQHTVSKNLLEYIKKKIDERKEQTLEKAPSVILTLMMRFFELFTLEESATQESKSFQKHHYNRCEDLFKHAEKANVFLISQNTSETTKPDALWVQLSLFFNGCPSLNRKQEDRSCEAKAYCDLLKWVLSPIFGTKKVDHYRLHTAITLLSKARMDIKLAECIEKEYGFKTLYALLIEACEQFPLETTAPQGVKITALNCSFQTSDSTELIISKNIKNWRNTQVSVHTEAYNMPDAHQILMMHLESAIKIMAKIDYTDFPLYLPILMKVFNTDFDKNLGKFSTLEWTARFKDVFQVFKSTESKVYYLDFQLFMIGQYLTIKDGDHTLIEETILGLIQACEVHPVVSSKTASSNCRKKAEEAGSFMALLSGSLHYCESEKIDWIKIKQSMCESIISMLGESKVRNDITLKSHYQLLNKEIKFSVKVENLGSLAKTKKYETLPPEEKLRQLIEDLVQMEEFMFAKDTFDIMVMSKNTSISKKVFRAIMKDIDFLSSQDKEKLLIRWVTHIGGFIKYPDIFTKEVMKDHYQALIRIALDNTYTLKSELVKMLHEASLDPHKKKSVTVSK